MTADWQLPPGVSRAVWDYVHDTSVASSYDSALAETPLLQADIEFVNKWLTHPRDLVDLGCGTGRLAIPLAKRGHRVVGVDLSQPMLQIARNKPDGDLVWWACANIVEMSAFRDAGYDAALCLFSTLGMVVGAQSRSSFICEAHRLLRPNGLLILHVHNTARLLAVRSLRLAWFKDLLRRLLKRPDRGDFPMPAADGLPGWTMHLFTRREISHNLRSAGFAIQEIVSIGTTGRPLRWPAAITAYGFLIAARKS